MITPPDYSNVHQITCSQKQSRHDFESLLIVSGPDGTWTKTEAAALIEAESDIFYTSEDGTVALVVAESGRHGRYIRTLPDCTPRNNLLNLPDCL